MRKQQEVWFRQITSSFAEEQPEYVPFVGLYLVTRCTDHLTQGAIVTDDMIICEQIHHEKRRLMK